MAILKKDSHRSSKKKMGQPVERQGKGLEPGLEIEAGLILAQNGGKTRKRQEPYSSAKANPA